MRVEFAGRTRPTGSNACPYPNLDPKNNAAIRIFGPAPNQFITESEIFQSANHGIDRGWTGGSMVDFLPSNICAVRHCKQTQARGAAGMCPSPVPCP